MRNYLQNNKGLYFSIFGCGSFEVEKNCNGYEVLAFFYLHCLPAFFRDAFFPQRNFLSYYQTLHSAMERYWPIGKTRPPLEWNFPALLCVENNRRFSIFKKLWTKSEGEYLSLSVTGNPATGTQKVKESFGDFRTSALGDHFTFLSL